jgi:predicted RNA-binding protein with PIN domain
MRTVIIDGNNLLHKMQNLKKLFASNPESAQLSLYETVKGKLSKNDKLILVFDGFSNIKSANIIFSGVKTADEIIRKYIEENYQKKSMAIISSDNEIISIAKACSCEILKSEDFVSEKKTLKNENINHLMPKDSEKPEGMSKRDFDFFKNKFS